MTVRERVYEWVKQNGPAFNTPMLIEAGFTVCEATQAIHELKVHKAIEQHSRTGRIKNWRLTGTEPPAGYVYTMLRRDHARVLNYMRWENVPVCVGDVVEQFGLKRSTADYIVNTLVRRGYIRPLIKDRQKFQTQLFEVIANADGFEKQRVSA